MQVPQSEFKAQHHLWMMDELTKLLVLRLQQQANHHLIQAQALSRGPQTDERMGNIYNHLGKADKINELIGGIKDAGHAFWNGKH